MTAAPKPAVSRGYAVDPSTGKTITVAMGTIKLRQRANPAGNKSFGADAFGRKRVVEINRLIDDRYPAGIPEHDDDDDGFLFPVAHAMHCGRSSDDEFASKLRDWIVRRMPWAAGRAGNLVGRLQARLHPRADHMTAAGVAGFLRSTEREKRELKLSTIGIYGMTAADYETWLIEERRRRDRERKSKPDRLSRAQWLEANATNRERPWEAEGISRATYFRRQKATGETGCSKHGETGCSTPIVLRPGTEQPVSNAPLAPSLADVVAGTGGGASPPTRCSQQTPGRLMGAGLCGDQLSFVDQLTDETDS